MKKIYCLVLFMIFFMGANAFSQNTETVTISTYYPSPYGVYQSIRLFPAASTKVPSCGEEQEGLMYYNDDISQKQLMVCRETSTGVYSWQAVGASYWTQPSGTNNLYTTDSADPNTTSDHYGWRVGVGTTDPTLGGMTNSKFSVAAPYDYAMLALGVAVNGGSSYSYIPSFAITNHSTTPSTDYDFGGAGSWVMYTYDNSVVSASSDDHWKRTISGKYGITYINRLVIEKRSSTPPSPKEGEMWIVE